MIVYVGLCNTKQASELIGISEEMLILTILFRKSILYEERFELPLIREKKNIGFELTQEEMIKIKTFISKFKRNRRFRFYIDIMKDQYKIKEVAKEWRGRLFG